MLLGGLGLGWPARLPTQCNATQRGPAHVGNLARGCRPGLTGGCSGRGVFVLPGLISNQGAPPAGTRKLTGDTSIICRVALNPAWRRGCTGPCQSPSPAMSHEPGQSGGLRSQAGLRAPRGGRRTQVGSQGPDPVWESARAHVQSCCPPANAGSGPASRREARIQGTARSVR